MTQTIDPNIVEAFISKHLTQKVSLKEVEDLNLADLTFLLGLAYNSEVPNLNEDSLEMIQGCFIMSIANEGFIVAHDNRINATPYTQNKEVFIFTSLYDFQEAYGNNDHVEPLIIDGNSNVFLQECYYDGVAEFILNPAGPRAFKCDLAPIVDMMLLTEKHERNIYSRGFGFFDNRLRQTSGQADLVRSALCTLVTNGQVLLPVKCEDCEEVVISPSSNVEVAQIDDAGIDRIPVFTDYLKLRRYFPKDDGWKVVAFTMAEAIQIADIQDQQVILNYGTSGLIFNDVVVNEFKAITEEVEQLKLYCAENLKSESFVADIACRFAENGVLTEFVKCAKYKDYNSKLTVQGFTINSLLNEGYSLLAAFDTMIFFFSDPKAGQRAAKHGL